MQLQRSKQQINKMQEEVSQLEVKEKGPSCLERFDVHNADVEVGQKNTTYVALDWQQCWIGDGCAVVYLLLLGSGSAGKMLCETNAMMLD